MIEDLLEIKERKVQALSEDDERRIYGVVAECKFSKIGNKGEDVKRTL